MRHKTASSFWTCYEKLPLEIRGLADKNFMLLKADPGQTHLVIKGMFRNLSCKKSQLQAFY